ncbi:MAG: flagellar biosynthesis protein FlhF [Nitrospiraceae bacterium]|nr:flagellar biosynthesis protein FlhF [Nitrospiraceae bacterium]
MGQTLHKFKAETYDAAYQKMVRKLGRDAVVVNTSEVTEGGLLGFLGYRMVELTARPAEMPIAPLSRRPSLAERRYRAAQGAGTPDPGKNINETVTHFRQLVSDAQTRMSTGPQATGSAVLKAKPPLEASSALTRQGPAILPARVRAREAAPVAEKRAESRRIEELQHEVREMRDLLHVVVAATPSEGFSDDFAPHYQKLLATGVAPKMAASLVAAVVNGSDSNVIRNPRVFTARLKMEMQKRMSVTGGIRLTNGPRQVVALVGATGVGKTTNAAKLAAHFAVEKRKRVALITTDTYRVAAPEQLRVYADIIGLPMTIANTAGELDQALRSFTNYDLVLVDTAGGSQFNVAQTDELQEIVESLGPDAVMLVLAANTQLEGLRSAVANFKRLRPTSLLFSKLDEARQYGGLYSIAAEANLPLSYFSTGQNVPDDIELASAGKVAKLLLRNGGSGVGPSA